MIVVFAGPSVGRAAARVILDADYRPPAANGDVVRAVLDGAEAIGIIDGYFEWTRSVWHKEILWALTSGTHVLGAASIGALRAVELQAFGMRGVGRIFELYRDGVLEDDDEVAVAHEPAGDYVAASVAMIDIRLSLESAELAGVIAPDTRDALQALAKRLFYPHRSYERLLVAGRGRVPDLELERLEPWLRLHRVDQKRTDAIALLAELARQRSTLARRFQPDFRLAESSYLRVLLADAGVSAGSDMEPGVVRANPTSR